MTTSGLKVTGINHVVLHVKDLDISLRFYLEVLGFEGRGELGVPGQQMAFLRCGAQGLDLFVTADEVHGGAEMNHMALEVEADEVRDVVRLLEEAGVESSAPTSRNSVFIHDPDGHQIEMLPRSAQARARARDATGVA